MTNKKSTAERTIEVLTWSSVVIWLGFVLMAGPALWRDYQWLVVMVLGVILLSSAIYQRSRNWDTSFAIWIFGIWMAVFSVLEIVSVMTEAATGSGLGIGLEVYLGVALISMGVASVFRIIQGPKIGPDLPSSQYPVDYREPRYGSTQRGRDDLDRGWAPSGRSQVERASSRDRGGDAYRPPDFGADRGRSTRYDDRYADQDRDRYNRAPDFDARRGEYGEYYADPTQSPQDPYFEEETTYQQRDDRRARRLDDLDEGWGQPAQNYPTQERQAEYGTQRLSRQRGRGRSQPQRATSRRSAPLPNQQQRPSAPNRARQPANDLESRVEDIIQRSRSRRAQPDGGAEDLPY